MQDAAGSHQYARFDSFEVNLRSGELARDGQKIRLTEQCFQILTMLLERPGEVVFRNEIQKKLWPNDTVVEFENSINAAIKKLRSALGDSAGEPRYIETLARRGYRFLAQVEWFEGGALQSPIRAAPQFPSPQTYLVGKKVSHYRVLDILGGGGMGVVYKAEDLRLGRRVALKFLPEEMASEPAALERFEHEAKAASALNHPNICTIYEIEYHEGQPFIVMELLEGETLRDLLSTAAPGAACLPLVRVVDLSIQIVKALDAAHQKGIVHRDIKPANIFVTNHGQAKILDFGLAKIVAAAVAEPSFSASADRESAITTVAPPESSTSALLLSRTGSAMGTAAYMSPEQVRGEKLDSRTDLFSFGLVLYEMATGQRAFQGNTASTLHEAILNQSPTPTPPQDLNREIPVRLEEVVSKALEKNREKRYQSAVEMLGDLVKVKEELESAARGLPPTAATSPRTWRRWLIPISIISILLVASAVALRLRINHAAKLSNQDGVILAEFVNSTGDRIFDGSLQRGLELTLQQSPFLNLFLRGKINTTLRIMGLPRDTLLTETTVQEVCRRAGARAFIAGSIASQRGKYAVAVKAVNCATGETLAQAQTVAQGKDQVLDALDASAAKLRVDLGESQASVWEYDVPLTQGVTTSLEALKAYDRAAKAQSERGPVGGLPLHLEAIKLDQNFALAYLEAGVDCLNGAGSTEEGQEYISKAFELQDHATIPRRLSIAGTYYVAVTGELDKVADTYEKTIAIYPRASPGAYSNLSIVYSQMGQYERAVEMARQAIPFNPDSSIYFTNLAGRLIALQRFGEARETLDAALARKPESDEVHLNLYALAFLMHDQKAMAEQLTWLKRHSDYEHLGLAREADSEAYIGHVRKARALTQQAVLAAIRSDKERAATWWASAALREALVGNFPVARRQINEAFSLAPKDEAVEFDSALALAMAGDRTRAEPLIQELNRRYPLDTEVQSLLLPTINAQLAVINKDPSRAIEHLKVAAPMELGYTALTDAFSCLWVNYVRGQAYLVAGNGSAAATEFQKILDHTGLVQNCPTGAMAHLGLARAETLQSHAKDGAEGAASRSRAIASYEEFFALWKDADPDIPLFKQAKVEYERLQGRSVDKVLSAND